MRPFVHEDLVAAARRLLSVAPPLRRRRLLLMLAQAEAAHRHLRRSGRVHRLWGNGSLADVAQMARLPPEPELGDSDYLRCLLLVLEEALARRDEATAGERGL